MTVDLEDLYRRSSDILSGEGSEERMSLATEAADVVIDGLRSMLDDGRSDLVDELLGRADVAMLHADVLDAILAVTEGVDGLGSFRKFEEEARAVISAVGARIPKKRLVSESGDVLSEDVRTEAGKRNA